MTTLDELAVSQEDQPNTSFYMADIQSDCMVWRRTDHSPRSRSELPEVSDKSPCAITAAIVSFSHKVAAATQLRFGVIYNSSLLKIVHKVCQWKHFLKIRQYLAKI